jgi:hypothetical protein
VDPGPLGAWLDGEALLPLEEQPAASAAQAKNAAAVAAHLVVRIDVRILNLSSS